MSYSSGSVIRGTTLMANVNTKVALDPEALGVQGDCVKDVL